MAFRLGKGCGVHINTVAAVFAAAHGYQVSLFQTAKFFYLDHAAAEDGYAVHPAFPGQLPRTVDLEIFGENGGRMIIIRRNTVGRGGDPACVGHILIGLLGKIRRGIDGHFKTHRILLHHDANFIATISHFVSKRERPILQPDGW